MPTAAATTSNVRTGRRSSIRRVSAEAEAMVLQSVWRDVGRVPGQVPVGSHDQTWLRTLNLARKEQRRRETYEPDHHEGDHRQRVGAVPGRDRRPGSCRRSRCRRRSQGWTRCVTGPRSRPAAPRGSWTARRSPTGSASPPGPSRSGAARARRRRRVSRPDQAEQEPDPGRGDDEARHDQRLLRGTSANRSRRTTRAGCRASPR